MRMLIRGVRIYKPKYMDETSAASVAKTAEREKEKKKQRTEAVTAAATGATAPPDQSKDVKTRSRARSIWGRKKSAAA